MTGLLLFVAATESNRQMLPHLNGSGPDGAPVPDTQGRLSRLITRARRASNRPAATSPGVQPESPGLRPSAASSAQ